MRSALLAIARASVHVRAEAKLKHAEYPVDAEQIHKIFTGRRGERNTGHGQFAEKILAMGDLSSNVQKITSSRATQHASC